MGEENKWKKGQKNPKHRGGEPQLKAALSTALPVKKDSNPVPQHCVTQQLHTRNTADVGWTLLKSHSAELLKRC